MSNSVVSAAKSFAAEAKEYAGFAGVVAGVLGGLLYVLLTWLCLDVYDPFGVDPSEVGLSYSALLMRTALGLIPILALTAIFGVVGAGVAGWVVRRSSRNAGWVVFWIVVGGVVAGSYVLWGDRVTATRLWPLLGPSGLGIAAGWVTRLEAEANADRGTTTTLRPALLLSAFLIASGAAWIFVSAAHVDRDRLRKGLVPRKLGGERQPPWDAHVVRVRWVHPKTAPTRLPLCLLQLGTADGVGVFYEATPSRERTLKIPNEAVLMEVLPDVESALPVKSHPGPCG